MPFQKSQLGRFGDLGMALTNMADPDHRSAHLLAVNGSLIGARPTLRQVLGFKGFWEPSDPEWINWLVRFGTLRNDYMTAGGHTLTARCTVPWAGFPGGGCGHELIPPLSHSNLRGFAQRLPTLNDNLTRLPDGSLTVDPGSRPLWLYVVTNTGEILLSSEDYELIKHTCIAGGLDVWSAGQVGIESRMIRLVDLQSGHYVAPNVGYGSSLAQALIAFTRDVFREYDAILNVACLHSQFDCVWA